MSSDDPRWVKAAYAANEAEAAIIQGLLSEHGISSVLQRAPGFDVPGYLAAGAYHVMVADEELERARRLVAGTPGAE